MLELQAGLYGVPKHKRKTEEILNNLRLTEQRNAYARTLSGGMRRRLLIGKALVHDPKVLILDEPTAGVDINLRRDMWRAVKELKENGVTIILTTHYIEEAELMANRIAVINNGKILLIDKKDKLIDRMK